MLRTRSIQLKKSRKDGIRICIMRRIKPEFEFDIWIPTLAPSTKLLKDYHEEKISWAEYQILFAKEVLKNQKKYIDIISNIAKTQTITLLCWEKTPDMCHRRLVAEKIKQTNPTLQIEIN